MATNLLLSPSPGLGRLLRSRSYLGRSHPRHNHTRSHGLDRGRKEGWDQGVGSPIVLVPGLVRADCDSVGTLIGFAEVVGVLGVVDRRRDGAAGTG
jgi:hypothetical protein